MSENQEKIKNDLKSVAAIRAVRLTRHYYGIEQFHPTEQMNVEGVADLLFIMMNKIRETSIAK